MSTVPPAGDWRKAQYDAWPHTRSALDVLRATARTHQDLARIKSIESAFRNEDVANFDPEFDRKFREAAAKLKGKS